MLPILIVCPRLVPSYAPSINCTIIFVLLFIAHGPILDVPSTIGRIGYISQCANGRFETDLVQGYSNSRWYSYIPGFNQILDDFQAPSSFHLM